MNRNGFIRAFLLGAVIAILIIILLGGKIIFHGKEFDKQSIVSSSSTVVNKLKKKAKGDER